jgi:hypothetical protein
MTTAMRCPPSAGPLVTTPSVGRLRQSGLLALCQTALNIDPQSASIDADPPAQGVKIARRTTSVRRAIRATGAKLFFLPPYSPDLNPIEQMFAKLKTLLPKAAARSVEATWKGIGRLLQEFSPQECANYLTNAGYAAS